MSYEFPDVEMWACSTLLDALGENSDLYVGIRIPDPRPTSFVVLNADPGPVSVVTAQVNLRVRTYAASEADAAALAARVRRLITAAARGHGGINVRAGGSLPAWFEDPANQPARVQWIPLLVRAHDTKE